MDAHIRACALLAIWLYWLRMVLPYNIRNHPCCQGTSENLTLAMIIDAFEIYGHDPTDKLDHLWLYQTEMMSIKTAEDQYLINERVHISADHLGRFINLHLKELKVLLITLDDVVDNMLTMYENHNSIAAERKATYTGGPVPMEFYLSQEYYCGKNVYIFVSELYSDIYNMGRGPAPFCKDRSFAFMGFLHYHDEQKYYLMDDPSITFPTDNFLHGLECHIGVCIFRFPFKKLLQQERDVVQLPKAIVKCGLVMYKIPPLSAATCIITSGSFILDFNIQGLRYRHHDYLLLPKVIVKCGLVMYKIPPLSAATCIITSGSFILDFNIQGLRYRHHDYLLLPKVIVKCGLVMYKIPPLSAATCIITSGSFILDFNIQGLRYQHHDYLLRIPNGHFYYSKEKGSPLFCDHHVCEWNYTNHYGGPFLIPGDPGTGIVPVPPYVETTTKPEEPDEFENYTVPYILDGCLFVYPPNYGSIAGKSYLDPVEMHDDRFTCSSAGNKGLYWYPQWMGAMPHHPYPSIQQQDTGTDMEPTDVVYPHQQDPDMD